MKTKEKVGLLGGTFNPVHRGHVDLGLRIQEAFGLDKVFYILSAQPPHKAHMEIAPAELRWRMLNEALKPFPQLVPCDIEMKRPTMSWTVDTVDQLKREYPETDFYFISGSEGFLKIRTWKDYKRLMRSLSFIVVVRKPGHEEAVEALLNSEDMSLHASSPSVRLFSYRSDTLSISSTLIRGKIKDSQQIDAFVEEEVQKIMEDNNLYES